METRVGYIAVGLFVLILGAGLIAAGLWFSADMTTREYTRYAIYTSESVSGLGGNADIKFQGVNVGRVNRIELLPDEPGRVRVLIDVERGTPVRADTTAQLATQGLTGFAHIELRGGSADAGEPEVPDGEQYAVIEMRSSLINRLEAGLARGVETLDELSGQVARLLDDENLDAITGTLVNLEQLSQTLLDNSHRLERMLVSGEKIMDQTAVASEQLVPLFEQIEASLAGVDTMSRSLEDAARRVGDASDEIGSVGMESVRGLQQLNTTTLPQLTDLMIELQDVAGGINRLTDEISEQPNRLIFGRPQRPAGPGEE